MNDRELEFEQGARAALRSAERDIDSASLERLATVRTSALAARPARWPWLASRQWLAGAAAAAVLGVAVLVSTDLWLTGDSAVENSQLADNPDFYSDLDFYVWLAESEMGQRG